MKFFTEEAFRNKLLALLGVLVLFLSQTYVAEVISYKSAYKSTLYRSFELYAREVEKLDIYLASLNEVESFDDTKPIYVEDSIISLLEYSLIQVGFVKSGVDEKYWNATYAYTDINSNFDLIRKDNKISAPEKKYLDALYAFNHENYNNAKKLIKLNVSDYQESKQLEKKILDIYIEHAKFLGENYEKSMLKNIHLDSDGTITNKAVDKDIIRDKLAVISKKLTGLDTLSYQKGSNEEEEYLWTYTTRANPKALERNDEKYYEFDYYLEENKVYFSQSYYNFDQDNEDKLSEDQMKELADDHIKKLEIKSEFVNTEKDKDSGYNNFVYIRKDNDIFYEAGSITVTVSNQGRVNSEFYLPQKDIEINWGDEKKITEKFDKSSKIKTIIKVINAKNEGEYVVMTEDKGEKYFWIFDSQTSELKLNDRLDEVIYPFYYNILMI